MCIYCTVCPLIFFLTLDAGLLARSQYSEGPATGHLDTGFSWFPCVYKEMLRWFPRFQFATTCFSLSPPDLKILLTNFIFCIHVNYPLPPGDNPIAVNYYYYYYYYCTVWIPSYPTDFFHNVFLTACVIQYNIISVIYSFRAGAQASGVPRNFVRGGGGSTNSVEDRGQKTGIWGR